MITIVLLGCTVTVFVASDTSKSYREKEGEREREREREREQNIIYVHMSGYQCIIKSHNTYSSLVIFRQLYRVAKVDDLILENDPISICWSLPC